MKSTRQPTVALVPLVLTAWLVPAVPASAAGIPVGNQAVVTVETGTVGTTTTLGGTVVPLKEVSFSAQMPGRVNFIAGVEGDWVKKGDTLVALDDADLQAKRRAVLAGMSNAQSAWRNARVQYSRQVYAGPDYADQMGMGMGKMMDRMITKPMDNTMGGGGSELTRRSQIYAQGTQIDQARSQWYQAKAQLEEIDAHLRDALSRAPFDGVIVRKSVEVGDTVQPGMPLLTFADTVNLQIKIDVPARLMPGIRKNMLIAAKLDVGDTRIETRVSQVYPMADPQRHTVTVKLDLPKNAPGGPGMYAEVIIPDVTTPNANLPVIPKTAVLWRGSLPGVLVVNQKNEAELRMVRMGGFVDDKTISVLSGLQSGERILAAPTNTMASGLNPMPDDGSKTPSAQ
ncbi:MAG: efflux RND transporter periplasmic adaptor subunit [Magnetococcus sp. DMHC-1]|nr:efflux RND transporter periplasmic adaptor subunit [Magnetococcales bacterium]